MWLKHWKQYIKVHRSALAKKPKGTVQRIKRTQSKPARAVKTQSQTAYVNENFFPVLLSQKPDFFFKIEKLDFIPSYLKRVYLMAFKAFERVINAENETLSAKEIKERDAVSSPCKVKQDGPNFNKI